MSSEVQAMLASYVASSSRVTGPVGPVLTGPLFEEIIGGAELPFT